MKKIPLTQGKCAIVDNDMLDYLNQWKWYSLKCQNGFYAARTGGKRPHRKYVLMHRQIMNAQKGEEIDHKDGDRLKNIKSNLRFCTRSQNLRNQHKINGLSRFKGVYLFKQRKYKNRQYKDKWRAQICLNGKNIHLGLFNSEIEAAIAYNKSAAKLFGQFAKLNNV